MLDRNRPGMRRMTANHIGVWSFVDSPGRYFSDRGDEVDDALAEAAGFNVKEGRRERLRQKLLDEARAEIDRKLADAASDIEKQLDAADKDPSKGDSASPFVEPSVEPPSESADEAPGYVIRKFDGQHHVIDTSTETIVGSGTKKEAQNLLADLSKKSTD